MSSPAGAPAATPAVDPAVDPAADPAVDPVRRRRATFHPLTVAAIDRLTDDSAAITFEVPSELSDDYAFEPGQSLTVRRMIDGEEQRRTYSICAPLGARPPHHVVYSALSCTYASVRSLK